MTKDQKWEKLTRDTTKVVEAVAKKMHEEQDASALLVVMARKITSVVAEVQGGEEVAQTQFDRRCMSAGNAEALQFAVARAMVDVAVNLGRQVGAEPEDLMISFGIIAANILNAEKKPGSGLITVPGGVN